MRTFLVVLWALTAAAQQPAPRPPKPQPQQQEPEQQPARRQDTPPIQPEDPVPQIVAQEPEAPPEAEPVEYRGPTILSRGGEASVSKGNRLLAISPFVSAEAIYESGLATVSVDRLGQYRTQSAYGGRISFGARGARSFRRSNLALDYRGDVRHYSKESYYDGSDHMLMLSYERQMSRRWMFALSQAAATFSRGFFLPVGVMNSYDPNFASLATNELFDTRTNALFSMGQMVYQHSARLSFAMSAAGYLVRRRSEALMGLNGWMAQGDTSYRLSRYSTLGVDYSFTRFHYQRAFGDTAAHSVGLNYATRLGRYWEMRLRLGGYRIETSRLQTIALDPAVALILGRTTGVEAFHGVTHLPAYAAQLVRSFRRSAFSATYRRAIHPGNGLLMTSGIENGDASLTSQVSRRVGLYFAAGASRYRGLSQTIGEYRSYHGGGGFSIGLPHALAFVARFDARNQSIRASNYDRVAYRATVGLAWTPGEFPLSIW